MRQVPLRQHIATREPALRSGHRLQAVDARRQAEEPGAPEGGRRCPAGMPAKGHPEIKTRESEPQAGCIGPRRPDQLALASVLADTALGHAEARSNRMAVTTSRRSRMPTSLAIVSSALQSAELR